MEIFFKEICLNILESSSSSFDQKWIAIQGIGSICNDAQIVVDIYVNYDCDLSAANIFERLVVDLSKIAQGRHAVDLDTGQNQLMRMRMKGLECLCNILKCMVEWSKDLYENPHARQKEVLDNSTDADDSLMESEMEKLFFIEKLKQHKDILERGFKLFSHKPTKGIKYLQENNIVGLEAEQIAKFLISENSRLDKTALGEFLGDHERIDVMHHYVDLIEFSEMELVAALRYFLESFRLPGESQKIDRLMLKFASRYIECNAGQKVFASADAAYVLAFSIIMLTTDLHSSHVKKKMTKEEFIKNNRGINESEDLPRDYLSAIYDEIASSEIKVRSSSPIGGSSMNGVGKKRNLQWTQESEARSLNAGALMESAITRSDTFTSAKHIELVKPMFKLIWSPLLANFSVGLQDSDDATITNLCIEGMKCAIRLADIFGLSLERNAFIQALARFTLLTDNSNIAEMKPKNMEAIRALISVAHSDGNYLESSWLDIMKCISQLENAQNTGTGSGTVQKLNEVSVHPESGPISNETNSQSILVPVDRLFQGN
jgi:brefeldin A-inhibited guanine nucleotide-exchange protein